MPRLKGSADLLEDRRRRALAMQKSIAIWSKCANGMRTFLKYAIPAFLVYVMLKYAIPAFLVYVMLAGGLYVAMLKPPAIFGHFTSNLPALTYLLFPFEPMWLVAPRGPLKVGDMAPDFVLKTADRSAEVRMSSFRGQQPVVLVFGSHT